MDTPNPHPATEPEPLSLMVHSMSLPEVEPGLPVHASGRWKALALILLCSVPVLACYWVYFFVRLQGHAEIGELIQPVQSLPEAVGIDLDGVAHPLAELKREWLLVSIAGGQCTETCQRRLYLQRQLRSMLGPDEKRVDWVWLVSDAQPVDASLRQRLRGGTVWRVPMATLQQWFRPAPDKLMEDYIFVVDPLGNSMMRFPAQMDLRAVSKAHHDLGRLMQASAAWNAPGR